MNFNNRIKLIVLLGFCCSSSVYGQNDIITVEKDSQSHMVSVSATIVPIKEITFTAQSSGRVVFIAGEEGTLFSYGHVLLALDDKQLRAKRQSAEAQLYQAYSMIENSQVLYRRELYSPVSSSQRPMAGMGMPAAMMDTFFSNRFYNPVFEREVDLHSSYTGINQARAAYVQAQSELTGIDVQLRDMRSIAPYNGTLIKKHVEVGDTIQPGQKLLTFAQTEHLQLKAEIPVRFVSNLQPGSILNAELDNKTQIQVRVAHIYPQADHQRHTVTVKFDLPPMMQLATGMYAKIFIPIRHDETSEQVVIPATALLRTGSLPRVLVVNRENKTELRVLRIGKIHLNGSVSVLSGLSSGERIINNPPPGVRSGWMPK